MLRLTFLIAAFLPCSLIMSGSMLRAFIGANDPASLENLYFAYSALSGGRKSVISIFARRLVTSSMERQTPEVTRELLAKVFSMGNLDGGMIRMMLRWIESPTSVALTSLLSVDSQRFAEALLDEISRLDSLSAETPRNAVGEIDAVLVGMTILMNFFF